MVTKAKLLIGAAIVGGALLGVYTSANLEREHLSFFTLENLESMARAELPEVEIVCGSVETTGRCWKGECEPFFTPFGFAKVWDCWEATGNPYDVCVDDTPCI